MVVGGDCMDVSNYYVFIVGFFVSYLEFVVKDIRSSGSNYVFVVCKYFMIFY